MQPSCRKTGSLSPADLSHRASRKRIIPQHQHHQVQPEGHFGKGRGPGNSSLWIQAGRHGGSIQCSCPVWLHKLCTAPHFWLTKDEAGLKFLAELFPPSQVFLHGVLPALSKPGFLNSSYPEGEMLSSRVPFSISSILKDHLFLISAKVHKLDGPTKGRG